MRYSGISLSSKQVQLVEPLFDDDPMTTADSVTCTLVGKRSETISLTVMQYTADLPVSDTWGWFANVNLPSELQTVTAKIEALRSGVRMRWTEQIAVTRY
jgi:hypothetical protein